MVVYFSGTGNSKYVAERIAGSLQEKLICMNERIKSGDTGSVKTGENLVVVVRLMHGESRVWFLTGSDRQNLSGRRTSGM